MRTEYIWVNIIQLFSQEIHAQEDRLYTNKHLYCLLQEIPSDDWIQIVC